VKFESDPSPLFFRVDLITTTPKRIQAQNHLHVACKATTLQQTQKSKAIIYLTMPFSFTSTHPIATPKTTTKQQKQQIALLQLKAGGRLS
jgi:hypothetical protein